MVTVAYGLNLRKRSIPVAIEVDITLTVSDVSSCAISYSIRTTSLGTRVTWL
jgi:hypothetical protein